MSSFPSDCTHELSDRIVFDCQRCTVAEMIREIDRRGWEIGLHPSWYSFDKAGEMKRQKVALEKALGCDVVSVRQHYLHYDIRVTPRVQAEACLKYDATLGFNDNVGFRFGTCYPWRLYDLQVAWANQNRTSPAEARRETHLEGAGTANETFMTVSDTKRHENG